MADQFKFNPFTGKFDIIPTSVGDVVGPASSTDNNIVLFDGTTGKFIKDSGSSLSSYQLKSEKGIANGYASLDSSAKVPVAQLPSSIMEYKGAWNASTNSPTLTDGTGDNGDVYRVSVAGTIDLGSGNITFSVGDFVIYNGSIWQRSPAGGTAGFTYFQIDASGGASDTYGLLSGTINGSNKVFTTSYGSYVSGSLQVYLNGQLQTQGTAEDWQETTPISGTFTFTTAPSTGDEIIVSYKYSTSVATNADTLDGYEATAFSLLNASNQYSKLQQFVQKVTTNISVSDGYYVLFIDDCEIDSSVDLDLVLSSIMEVT